MEKMSLTTCPMCKRLCAPTKDGKFRKHGPKGQECDMSGLFVPGRKEESWSESPPSVEESTASSVASPPGDAPETVPSATSTTTSSPEPPEPEGDASIPGVDRYAEKLNGVATGQAEAYREKVDAWLAANRTDTYAQPATPYLPEQEPLPFSYSQPASAKVEAKPDRPMTRTGVEIAARLKEMFYAYNNRRSSDNRSAQSTLGPSEIGTPCDRRLAMSLLQIPPVNPGGDGWASFVGTAIHAALADMFLWANGGSGRYEVEMPLRFPSTLVPKGTGDLLDRTMLMFMDHKCQGSWSRNKLKTQGPGDTYRIQVHTYAWGATMRGEKVEHVAIISWPREASNLDDLYVWTEPYNPSLAHDAMARVDGLAKEIEVLRDKGYTSVQAAATFDTADPYECKYCPFHLPNARHLQHGCNGKR